MTSTSIPIRFDSPLLSGSTHSLLIDPEKPTLIERFFLHPRWAMQMEVEIRLFRRMQVLDAPGWHFLPFTVGDVPELKNWIEKQTSILYQKERAELANFLNGAASCNNGCLPRPLLLMPGMYTEFLLSNPGEETIPPCAIGILLGRELTASETAHHIDSLNQELRFWYPK